MSARARKPSNAQAKIEYGDFQTPLELAERICRKLVEFGVHPATVVEPTCGQGAFLRAAAQYFPAAQRVIGCEINAEYLAVFRQKWNRDLLQTPIELEHEDFFVLDWRQKLSPLPAPILLLGNLPWVTNAVQGTLCSDNLPVKKNCTA